MSLIGAEWVLVLLVILSVLSISLIFDRVLFYRAARSGLVEFREKIRSAVASGNYDGAEKEAAARLSQMSKDRADLETEMAYELLRHSRGQNGKRTSPDVLSEVARDAVFRSRLSWDRNLSMLATIGSNAPFWVFLELFWGSSKPSMTSGKIRALAFKPYPAAFLKRWLLQLLESWSLFQLSWLSTCFNAA
jgi:hypothetical protein